MSSPSLHGVSTLDLRPYVVNISTPTFGNKFDDEQSTLSIEPNNDAPASAPVSAPISAASTPRPMMNNNNSVQYQDEDMHSQHLPSMTLSAIMNSNTNSASMTYHRSQTPVVQLQIQNDDSLGYDDSLTTVATPKQLKHCRQDSILNILPIPMQFQDDIDPYHDDSLSFVDVKAVHKPQLKETPQTSDVTEQQLMNENDKKRWRGFFNFFQTGTHAAHTTNLKKAVESIPKKSEEEMNGAMSFN
eukprot:629440_1